MRRALIMAGGQGSRMRASGVGLDKPLVTVLGVPLLERNLLPLLEAGFTEITVALPAGRPPLSAFTADRAVPLAAAWGARLEPVVEATPLGTVGLARELLRGTGPLLVVYADNLFGLDWDELWRTHAASGADLTLAAHMHDVQLAYGVLEGVGEAVTAYREKPRLSARVCSGAAVLGPALADCFPGPGACGLDQLVNAALAAGCAVRAHLHERPWIDVNDQSTCEKATELVRTHAEAFERLRRPFHREVVGLVLTGPEGVLLERRREDAWAYAGYWDTPGGKVEPGESPAQALVREAAEELGVDARAAVPVAVFDDVELPSGQVFRHHLFRMTTSAPPVAREGQTLGWHGLAGALHLPRLAQPARRSLAWCGVTA